MSGNPVPLKARLQLIVDRVLVLGLLEEFRNRAAKEKRFLQAKAIYRAREKMRQAMRARRGYES